MSYGATAIPHAAVPKTSVVNTCDGDQSIFDARVCSVLHRLYTIC